MFNFKLKENNTSFFKLKSDNVSNFSLKENNFYSFMIHALEATISKKIEFREKYSSMVFIGGRKKLLQELLSTPLRELPTSLRELIGSYVYLRAKLRLNELNISVASVAYKVLIKLRALTQYGSRTNFVKLLIKAFAKINETNKSMLTNVKNVLIAKLKFNQQSTHSIQNLIHRLVLKTKPTINYSYSVVSNKVFSVIAKLKIDNADKSLVNLHGLLRFKNKLKDLKYSLNVYQKSKIKAKTRLMNSKNISNVSIGNLPLELYKTDKLSELPPTLKQFIGKYVRLLAKTRFNDSIYNNATNNTVKSRAKLKLSSDIKNECSLENTNLYQCVQLIEYENAKLTEVPSSLFSFCYVNPLNTWSGVNKLYATWEEVSKLNSWGDLIEQKTDN